jgi:hypothetical protein
VKFPIVWNILNREITGITTLVPGYIGIPPLVAYPGTITAYFEAVCKNANASAQDLYLRMDSDSAFASPSTEKTLSITGSTSNYTRFRSTSFTLDVDNQYKGIQPNSTDLSILCARVITIVDTGTDDLLNVKIPFDIGGYEIFDYSDTVEHNLVNPKFWKYDSADWEPGGDTGLTSIPGSLQLTSDVENDAYPVDFEFWSFTTPPTATSWIQYYGHYDETPRLRAYNGFHPSNGLYYGWRVEQGTSMRGGTFYSGHILIDHTARNGSIFQKVLTISLRNIYGGTGTEEASGQSFTTVGAIDLKAIAFGMRKLGSPTDNLKCEIYDGLSGSLVTNGTSNNIAASNLCHFVYGSVVVFEFSTPPSLDAATKYYARVTRSGSRDTTNRAVITQDASDYYSGGAYLTRNSGTWSENGSGHDCMFFVISTDDKITKFQLELPMITANQTDTGLQDFIARYDPNEWDGVDVDAFHEQYASGAGSNTKLQEDLGGTPSDIANSSITGANVVRGGTAMTMPSSADDIDTNIVTA